MITRTPHRTTVSMTPTAPHPNPPHVTTTSLPDTLAATYHNRQPRKLTAKPLPEPLRRTQTQHVTLPLCLCSRGSQATPTQNTSEQPLGRLSSSTVWGSAPSPPNPVLTPLPDSMLYDVCPDHTPWPQQSRSRTPTWFPIPVLLLAPLGLAPALLPNPTPEF